MGKRKAFTVLELLVWAVILVRVIALLLPPISQTHVRTEPKQSETPAKGK